MKFLKSITICSWIFTIFVIGKSTCAEYADTLRLRGDLLRGSPDVKDIKPRRNQTEQVSVYISLFINSIQDFDEVSGNLFFTGSFAIYWTDDLKIWDPESYGGIQAIDLPLSQTWTPTILIRNGIEKLSLFRFDDELDIEKSRVTYSYNGSATILIHGLYHVICRPDVTYYPCDEHKCRIIVITDYFLNDVKLVSANGIFMKGYLEGFLPNTEWSITKDYTIESYLFVYITEERKTYQDQIEIIVFIGRDYLFLWINLFVPFVVLSMTNALVFFLPIESGERTSFSLTMFLTMVVFMTIVSDKIPPSNTISFFNWFVLQQLLSSVFIMALNVFSIRIYHTNTCNTTEDPLDRLLLKIHRVVDKNWYKNHDETVDDVDKWKRVSHCFDTLCFVVLFVIFNIQYFIFAFSI